MLKIIQTQLDTTDIHAMKGKQSYLSVIIMLANSNPQAT